MAGKTKREKREREKRGIIKTKNRLKGKPVEDKRF